MSLGLPQLSGTLREAFTAGSGVDSSRLKLVLTAATVSLVAAFFGWLISVTLDNYRNGRIRQEQVVEACIRLGILFSLIVWVLV
ncbi:DUF3262 family protein [Diaphorobacter sp. HDW4A]|uniref:DUF3262 family protein n=1 Tax=Diaphorobacter sp. HDW4A TaxID=2714924 RepID=UPI001407CD7D|nr:DUF3262 family protein [Diaphorobacter sp. HDW4A]QIL80327.1 DUF3262 family protein [Diaphorobacter sp. HDW4A]